MKPLLITVNVVVDFLGVVTDAGTENEGVSFITARGRVFSGRHF